MNKIFLLTFLVFAMGSFSVSAEEVNLSGECILSYKGRIYSQGPCKAVIMNNKAVEVTATVPENNVKYNAIISEEKQTGVLIGAGTFVLADGPLEQTTAGATYVWPNGYALETKMTFSK